MSHSRKPRWPRKRRERRAAPVVVSGEVSPVFIERMRAKGVLVVRKR